MQTRIFLAAAPILLLATLIPAQSFAQNPEAKKMSKDQAYLSIGKRVLAMSESPATAIVAEVDSVLEVTSVTMEPDGKAMVTIRERTPSSAAYTNKSTRLKFSPPPSGSEWNWTEFEENRKFYPVDKLFPYAKDELGRRRQVVNAKWATFVTAIGKQAESANKPLETAKAVIKSDPPPLAQLTTTRAALTQALKDNDTDATVNSYKELVQLTEPVTTLADNHTDLKANDAYLRLIDEFKNSVNVTEAARKDYAQSVDAYNEALVRLPFALVAYGLNFTKIDPKVTTE